MALPSASSSFLSVSACSDPTRISVSTAVFALIMGPTFSPVPDPALRVALKSCQNFSNSSSCISPSPFSSTMSTRLWMSSRLILTAASRVAVALPPAVPRIALSSSAEMLPPPSLSSRRNASSCDMLSDMPVAFERTTWLAKLRMAVAVAVAARESRPARLRSVSNPFTRTSSTLL